MDCTGRSVLLWNRRKKTHTSQEQNLYPLKCEQLAALTFHWMRLVFFIYLILKVNVTWNLYCEGSIVERLWMELVHVWHKREKVNQRSILIRVAVTFHDLLVDCIDCLCCRVRGTWEESRYFTNKIFFMKKSRHVTVPPSGATTTYFCSLFLSFWMNVKGSGCALASKCKSKPRFNLFCTNMSVTLFRCICTMARILSCIFFSELMNLKLFFLWGALWGVCITKAVLVLHTNDVTLWHAPRTAAALSMYVFPTHSIILPLDTGCNQFLTHSISNSSYLCLSFSGIKVSSLISLTLISLTPFSISRHLSSQRIQYEQKANVCLKGSKVSSVFSISI